MADFNRDNTLPRDIVDEMQESYLNYSMSVIVAPGRKGRAQAGSPPHPLWDERTGLKLEPAL